MVLLWPRKLNMAWVEPGKLEMVWLGHVKLR